MNPEAIKRVSEMSRLAELLATNPSTQSLTPRHSPSNLHMGADACTPTRPPKCVHSGNKCDKNVFLKSTEALCWGEFA